jgi:hypothetical protein
MAAIPLHAHPATPGPAVASFTVTVTRAAASIPCPQTSPSP